jgi:SAM-dependent methyltransferase
MEPNDPLTKPSNTSLDGATLPNVRRKALKTFHASSMGKRLVWHVKTLIPVTPPQERLLAIGFPSPLLDAVVTEELKARGAATFPKVGLEQHGQDSSETATITPMRTILELKAGGSLPLKAPAHFSTVVLLHSLEYAPYPQHLMREVWRVLKPGGLLLMVLPTPALGRAMPALAPCNAKLGAEALFKVMPFRRLWAQRVLFLRDGSPHLMGACERLAQMTGTKKALFNIHGAQKEPVQLTPVAPPGTGTPRMAPSWDAPLSS